VITPMDRDDIIDWLVVAGIILCVVGAVISYVLLTVAATIFSAIVYLATKPWFWLVIVALVFIGTL